MRLLLLHILFLGLTALPLQLLSAHGTERIEDVVVGGHQDSGLVHNDHCAPSTDDPCNDIHPGKDCPPDTDGCGHCHCPGCGVTGMTYAGFFRNAFVEMSAPGWLFVRRAANFCYQAPSTSPHLAALFRPPIDKLG